MQNHKDLTRLAKHYKFTVTSSIGGKHNVGSLHSKGLAIDVRTRGKAKAVIEAFITACEHFGVKVRDERIKPKGQKVWSGSHLHLEITAKTNIPEKL